MPHHTDPAAVRQTFSAATDQPACSPWWDRQRHADRRPLLLTRNRIRDAARRYFSERDFVEVESGALVVSPGNEPHLHAFATEAIAPDGTRMPMFLHTSPEFACKKLLAAGERRIVDFARVFRNRERGALHAAEFTMLEWYRADEPYTALMDDCAAVLTLAADAAGVSRATFRGREADPRRTPERLSVTEAFARHAGLELSAAMHGRPGDRDILATQARRAGVRVAPDDTWSDVFSRVLVERVEPHLGIGGPTFLDRYPLYEAALARPAAEDPSVAERFELYLCGVELANGFGELTDPAEQRRRCVAAMDDKQRIYGERYPLDEAFLSALAAMPAASGVALGFDRLVMLMTHAQRIEQVMWTPGVCS